MPLFRRIATPALLGSLGVVLLAPSSAMAEGMPQLDFHNPLTISQVVWGVIIFVVLYILVSKFALPRVGSVLDERAGHIAADLDSARQASQRAEAGKAEAVAATSAAAIEKERMGREEKRISRTPNRVGLLALCKTCWRSKDGAPPAFSPIPLGSGGALPKSVKKTRKPRVDT